VNRTANLAGVVRPLCHFTVHKFWWRLAISAFVRSVVLGFHKFVEVTGCVAK
jgi:hypothetical protein